MRKQTKGCILLLLCAMIWGAAFVAQSEGMQYVGPFTMGATRFFLAGLVLLPVIRVLDRKGWSQNRPVTKEDKKRQLAAGAICGVLLCGAGVKPAALLEGGTGSISIRQEMPDFLSPVPQMP